MTKDETPPRFADALKARCLLVLGGVFGVHHLYLEQIPEAFIYLSTGGLFMLGVYYDSFFMPNIVDKYNQKQEKESEEEESKKYKNGKLMPTLSRMVRFSMSHLVLSLIYGMWLGFLCWIAGSVTFGLSMQDSLVMVSAMAAAVSAGVYLVGNRDGESRDLLYIWIAAFSTSFIVCKLFNGSCLRVLLFSSLAATLLGNRTARVRAANQKPFNFKHYLFWSSLFALLVCVIAIGASRHILDKRVSASKPGDSTVTSSIGSLVKARLFGPVEHVRSFFKDDPRVDYKRSADEAKEESRSLWDLDLVGRAPEWASRLTVFVVDILRAESKVLEKTLKEEPLKWASWRAYLLVWFEASPFVSDTELSRLCSKWKREQPKGKAADKARDYRVLAVARGCEVVAA